MEKIIEQKAHAFLTLSNHPLLLVIFIISLLLCIGVVAFIIMAIRKPEQVLKLFKIDRTKGKPAIDVCNDCMKTSSRELKESVDKIIESIAKNQEELDQRLKSMTAEISINTIYSGLSAIYTEGLTLPEYLDILFRLWRNGINGNTIARAKVLIMKFDGVKIWHSELSKNLNKHGEGSRHFQECIKKVNEGLA